MVKESRPTLDEYYISMCELAATRSVCLHRHAGAVIVRDKRSLSQGWNGPAENEPHCTELGQCNKEATGHCRAEGAHAEINAIVNASRAGTPVLGSTIYSLWSPCESCCRMIKNSGISTVRYKYTYDHFPSGPEYLQSMDIVTECVMSISEAEQIIDGAILSDCGIHDRALRISLSGAAHIDWLLHIKNALLRIGSYIDPKYPRIATAHSKGKEYTYVELTTRACSVMKGYQDAWYCNGVKEVLEGFSFTPISLANEFMGDGSSRVDRTCIDARLSTEGYSERSIAIIEHALRGIGIPHTSRAVNKRVKTGSGISIMILQDDVNKFMDIVEPYVLPSFKYKIKRRQEPVTESRFVQSVRRGKLKGV